jgi:hypothetical protein
MPRGARSRVSMLFPPKTARSTQSSALHGFKNEGNHHRTQVESSLADLASRCDHVAHPKSCGGTKPSIHAMNWWHSCCEVVSSEEIRPSGSEVLIAGRVTHRLRVVSEKRRSGNFSRQVCVRPRTTHCGNLRPQAAPAQVSDKCRIHLPRLGNDREIAEGRRTLIKSGLDRIPHPLCKWEVRWIRTPASARSDKAARVI